MCLAKPWLLQRGLAAAVQHTLRASLPRGAALKQPACYGDSRLYSADAVRLSKAEGSGAPGPNQCSSAC